MVKVPRYSIKTYLLLLVVSATVGVMLTVSMLLLIGFGLQGTLVVLMLSFPFWLFGILYGFYKGLVKHYGMNGNENIFLGGKF